MSEEEERFFARMGIQACADGLARHNGLDVEKTRAFVFEMLTEEEVIVMYAKRSAAYPEHSDPLTRWLYAAVDLLMERVDVGPGWIGAVDERAES